MPRTTYLGDAMIIIGVLIVLIWALLKTFNIIHSPPFVEYLPFYGFVLTILGGFYGLGKIKESMSKDIEFIKEKLEKIVKIEERFIQLEKEHRLVKEGKLKLAH